MIVEIIGGCECSDETAIAVANTISNTYRMNSNGVELKVDAILATSRVYIEDSRDDGAPY